MGAMYHAPQLCAFRAVFNSQAFQNVPLDELLNLMLQVEKAYDVDHPAAPRVRTGFACPIVYQTAYDLRFARHEGSIAGIRVS